MTFLKPINLILFLLLLKFNLSAQCPSAIVENKTKVFYKDVLNEYKLKLIKGGQFTISTENGELTTINNKKYIKPNTLGRVVIKIKETIVNKENATTSSVELYDYFECVNLPKPTINFISNQQDTLIQTNTITKDLARKIKSIFSTNTAPDILYKPEIVSFTLTIIGQNDKIKSIEISGNYIEMFCSLLNIGDKIIFTNIKAKLDNQTDIFLENKVIEVTK